MEPSQRKLLFRTFLPSESRAIGQNLFHTAEEHAEKSFLDILVAVNTWRQRLCQQLKYINFLENKL